MTTDRTDEGWSAESRSERRESAENPNESRAIFGTETRISVIDISVLLLRYRRLILVMTLSVPLAVAAVTLVASQTWTAGVSFMPNAASSASRSQLQSLSGQLGVDLGRVGPGQTVRFYEHLILSREILGGLAADSFRVGHTSESEEGQGRYRKLAGLLEVDAEQPEIRRAAVLGWLKNSALSVTISPEADIVEVSVTTPWPKVSARIADRIIDHVNGFNLESRQSQAAAERRFIANRMEEAQVDLRSAENALQAFLQNNRQFQNSPELIFEHDRLQRQVSMRQEVYTSLVQAYQEARIAEVRNTPVITVVEPAEIPVTPDPRRLHLKLLLAALLGGTIGVLVSATLEFLAREVEGSDRFQELLVLWTESKTEVQDTLRLGRK